MKIGTSIRGLFACAALTAALTAQTSKGILVGVARDASGAVVANATVTIVGAADGLTRADMTKGDGSYRFEGLSPETYTVSVSQPGFKSYAATNVNVQSSLVTTYDLNLSVGSATESVSVNADTLSIDTANGQLSGVINSTDLAKLPIFSLNPFELATTLPGVQLVNQSGFSNGLNIQVNGARPRANNFLLDGQEINDVGIGGQAFQPAIPDVFSSFTVITNSASAEYGRAGGAIANLITKAGTNSFHGTAYERYNGSGLNALDGVTRQQKPIPAGDPNPKARTDTHTYGFTAGGPIIKNKLFAFGAWQLQRVYGKETPNRLELPDQAGYNTLKGIGGPQFALLNSYLSNGSYLTAYIPYNSGVVTKINVGPQNGCPATGCIVTTGYFQRQNASISQPDTQWTYRIDFNPRDKDNFYFRYLHDRASFGPDFGNNGSALAGFDTLQGGPTELGAGGWTHVFTPNLINEFRVSEARLGFTFAPTAETLANPLYALATINVSNIPSLGPNQNFPQGRHEDLYQLQDTVGLTKGRQAFRSGFDIGRLLETDIVSLNAKGTLTFARGGTYVSSLGNFLQNQLGPSGTATKTFGSTRVDPHGWRSGGFVQDDIKLNADLTLNLGLRYDYTSNPENSLPYPGIDPTNPFVPIDTVLKVTNETNNVAPRVGFAYSPHGSGLFGEGKTVVRGGFGIFYDSYFSNIVVNAAQSSPNAVSGLLTQTTGSGLTNATGLIPSISPTLRPTSAVTSVVNNLVNPLTYQFNFGVERQLPGQIIVETRYVGSLGKKLFANRQYNYFDYTTAKRLNPGRGAINARGNFAGSNYNGLEVNVSHGFSHGFQVRGTYSYSKDLDNASEIFATFASPTSYNSILAPGGNRFDYGPSAYDHRHYASFSYVYSPSGFRSQNTFANGALGLLTRHWTISGTEQFQSGPYSSFTEGSGAGGLDTNGDGSTVNDRPLLGNASAPLSTAAIDGTFVNGTPGVYYDLSANNATGALNPIDPNSVHWLIANNPGNKLLAIGRDSFSNPGLQYHNVAVEKGIGLSYFHFERGRLLLRAEAQNVGNHNNVGPLDTNVLDIGSDSYLNKSNARQGAGDSQTPGRQIILWGKLVF